MALIGRKIGNYFALFSVLALLAACTDGVDDLDDFFAEVESKPKGRITPLPPIETSPPFSYGTPDRRSPFEPPVLVRRPKERSGPQVLPDFNRVKQFLEQFPLTKLQMVGTIAQDGSRYALLKDVQGAIHRVTRGDYVGTDHGMIKEVSESSVELTEIVPDGAGGWIERARSISLVGGV